VPYVDSPKISSQLLKAEKQVSTAKVGMEEKHQADKG